MIKKISYFVLALLVIGALTIVIVIWPYYSNVQYYPPNSEKGYYAGFYIYISPGAKAIAERGEAVTFLIQPNNSGTNSDDPAVHKKDAWWMGFERHKIANKLNVVLLVPAFIRPGEDWRIYTHALDRDVLTTSRQDLFRLDLQLLGMIEDARADLKSYGIDSREKFLLQGFSASGMFANRFTVLHPTRVLAVAFGSPGGWPIAPVKEYRGTLLPYPAGVADLETLTGKPFDSAAFVNVPQLVIMGSADDNDSLDFSDGWDKDAASTVDSLFGNEPQVRWRQSELLYKSIGANVKFVLVDGVGHDRKQLQSYGVDFFAKVLKDVK